MIVFTYPRTREQQKKAWAASGWTIHLGSGVEDASSISGRDLAALLLETNDDELKETKNAQLATFLTSMVIFDALQRAGVDAAAHAGHGLGEYSASNCFWGFGFGGRCETCY